MVKLTNYLFSATVAIVFSLLLAACKSEETNLVWDGEWERTIHVPEGLQGRCVSERLTLEGKSWMLLAIVHSTYECNQPFLELLYEGTLKEVKIKRNSDDRDIRFQVHDIHLAGMVDVAGSSRAALSESAVENLSSKYVPEKFQFFEQKSYLEAGEMEMNSDIYKPVIDFAIPGYPEPVQPLNYKRAR